MDAHPFQRLPRAEAVTDGLKHGGAGPDLRMAVHAGLGGRNSGKAGVLNRGMAVAAIQADAGNVMLMAEWNRLLRRNMLGGDIRRALKFHERRAYRRKKKYYAKDAGARQGICTAVKDLCYLNIKSLPAKNSYTVNCNINNST